MLHANRQRSALIRITCDSTARSPGGEAMASAVRSGQAMAMGAHRAAHTTAFLREAEVLARHAEEAFDSRAELQAWLSCALAQRLGASPKAAAGCGEASALACAMPFRGGCPRSMSARDLDAALSRLPTRRLQALLRLERHSRTVLGPPAT